MPDTTVDPYIVIAPRSPIDIACDEARHDLFDLTTRRTLLEEAAAIGRRVAALGRTIERQALAQSASHIPAPAEGRALLFLTFGPAQVTSFDANYGFVTVDYPADADTDRVRAVMNAWFPEGYAFAYGPEEFAAYAARYPQPHGEIRRIVLETV